MNWTRQMIVTGVLFYALFFGSMPGSSTECRAEVIATTVAVRPLAVVPRPVVGVRWQIRRAYWRPFWGVNRARVFHYRFRYCR
jgi:hypothetical protein